VTPSRPPNGTWRAVPAVPAFAGVVTVPAPVVHLPLEAFTKNGVDNAVAGGKPATFERRGAPEDLQLVPGVQGQAVKFDGDAGFILRDFRQVGRFDPLTFSAFVRLGEKNARATLLHSTGFYTGDGDATGIELLLDHGKLRWSMIHLWPNSAAIDRDRRGTARRRLASRDGHLRRLLPRRRAAPLPRWARSPDAGGPRHLAREAPRQLPGDRHALP